MWKLGACFWKKNKNGDKGAKMADNTMEKVYRDAQAACGLKVGDCVRVTRKADDCEAGWGDYWAGPMDRTVGKIGTIENILSNKIKVSFPDPIFNSWNYPYFVLEKVAKSEEPKFKVGDTVRVVRKYVSGSFRWAPSMDKAVGRTGMVLSGNNTTYLVDIPGVPENPWYYCAESLELVKEEENNCRFKPFDRVLVRDNDKQAWKADIFSHIDSCSPHEFRCACAIWRQCIPYEGNEHLLGTKNNPKE